MKTYVESGEVLDITNATGADVAAGTAFLCGKLLVVPLNALASTATGPCMTEGVFTLAKNTGTGTGASQGEHAYWDASAKKLTAVSTSNTLVGKFAYTAADGDATAKILINVV